MEPTSDRFNARRQDPGPAFSPISAPGGLNIHPRPRLGRVLTKRGAITFVAIAFALLVIACVGLWWRHDSQETQRKASQPANIGPATQAGTEVVKDVSHAQPPGAHQDGGRQLQPPSAVPNLSTATALGAPACAADPQTGQPYRFNPQTGQPCDGLPQERVVVRQAPVIQPRLAPMPSPQQTAEELQRAAALQELQAAMTAPTSVRGADLQSTATPAAPAVPDAVSAATLSSALNRAREGAGWSASPSHETEYDEQNAQSQKEAFLKAAREQAAADYLPSIRTAPLSRYEIRAGWEIPAILEQNLNSDLPGELKALVAANVYDTATGLYLLIPQGSRLIGKYDSHVSYGQDGITVVWNRLIYPDASSIDLDGMQGLDSHGNSGLRDTVDHHYKRLIGGVALSSLFTAGFAISQATNQSVLAYQTPGQAASAAVGQEVSQTGAQLTRRNLNTQPTIKVPAGYRFTVRVDRDILFDAPYEPMPAASLPLAPSEKQLRHRTTEGN
jgi:type IV secretion system protein VirB10